MTTEDQINDGKLQYDINREAAKISAIKQQYYYNYLNKILRGNKSANQKRTLANINIFLMQEIVFIENYSSMILEAKKLAQEQEGIGLKILTPNQMLKRLPIALAQIKAGNNLERLLNEIRQIAYSLYRSKKITKKVCNKSIIQNRYNRYGLRKE